MISMDDARGRGRSRRRVFVLHAPRCVSYRRALTWLLVALLAGYLVFQSDWFQRKFFYPLPYRDLVSSYAAARRLDPMLVAGVILSESGFRQEARSHKGAAGLMQLMPETAQWIAEQLDDRAFSLRDLNDPDKNIRFGTWYLSSLEMEFAGNEVLMLAAYNAGRGNVRAWMDKYGWDMNFSDISQIPFQETRCYVERVLRSKEAYRRLYP